MFLESFCILLPNKNQPVPFLNQHFHASSCLARDLYSTVSIHHCHSAGHSRCCGRTNCMHECPDCPCLFLCQRIPDTQCYPHPLLIPNQFLIVLLLPCVHDPNPLHRVFVWPKAPCCRDPH